MIDREQINLGILSAYKKCRINNFPLNCADIINKYGYSIMKYSELKPKKLKACLELSEDSTLLKSTIYYNDAKPNTRIRFSMMHEIGHVVMNTHDESIADSFSSHMLAPRIAIHYSKCNNAADVMKRFDLSEQASNIAFDDYRIWRREVSIRGLSTADKEIYNHFYNSDADKFVWKIQKCDFCYDEYAYNGEILCNTCKLFEIRKKTYARTVYDPREKDLDVLRGNWLYGGL